MLFWERAAHELQLISEEFDLICSNGQHQQVIIATASSNMPVTGSRLRGPSRPSKSKPPPTSAPLSPSLEAKVQAKLFEQRQKISAVFREFDEHNTGAIERDEVQSIGHEGAEAAF